MKYYSVDIIQDTTAHTCWEGYAEDESNAHDKAIEALKAGKLPDYQLTYNLQADDWDDTSVDEIPPPVDVSKTSIPAPADTSTPADAMLGEVFTLNWTEPDESQQVGWKEAIEGERTNEDRARTGHTACVAAVKFRDGSPTIGDDEMQETIQDTIADILHLARWCGISTCDMLRSALNHYTCEQKGEV